MPDLPVSREEVVGAATHPVVASRIGQITRSTKAFDDPNMYNLADGGIA